jgi:hypothetical protein
MTEFVAVYQVIAEPVTDGLRSGDKASFAIPGQSSTRAETSGRDGAPGVVRDRSQFAY